MSDPRMPNEEAIQQMARQAGMTPEAVRKNYERVFGAGAKMRELELAERVPIASGQVWRSRLGGTASLVFVDRTHRGNFCVALVDIGSDFADDTTAILPPEVSPLGVAFTVWLDFEGWAKPGIFDYLICDTGHESVAGLRSAVADGTLTSGLPILNRSGRREPARNDARKLLSALTPYDPATDDEPEGQVSEEQIRAATHRWNGDW